MLKKTKLKFNMMILLSLIFTLSGCGTTDFDKNDRFQTTNDVMQSWVGYNESQLIGSWGAPENTFQNRDGSRVMTWKHYRETDTTYGYCTQTFLSDKNGIIQAWKYNFCQYNLYNLPRIPKSRPVPKPSL